MDDAPRVENHAGITAEGVFNDTADEGVGDPLECQAVAITGEALQVQGTVKSTADAVRIRNAVMGTWCSVRWVDDRVDVS